MTDYISTSFGVYQDISFEPTKCQMSGQRLCADVLRGPGSKIKARIVDRVGYRVLHLKFAVCVLPCNHDLVTQKQRAGAVIGISYLHVQP